MLANEYLDGKHGVSPAWEQEGGLTPARAIAVAEVAQALTDDLARQFDEEAEQSPQERFEAFYLSWAKREAAFLGHDPEACSYDVEVHISETGFVDGTVRIRPPPLSGVVWTAVIK